MIFFIVKAYAGRKALLWTLSHGLLLFSNYKFKLLILLSRLSMFCKMYHVWGILCDIWGAALNQPVLRENLYLTCRLTCNETVEGVHKNTLGQSYATRLKKTCSCQNQPLQMHLGFRLPMGYAAILLFPISYYEYPESYSHELSS